MPPCQATSLAWTARNRQVKRRHPYSTAFRKPRPTQSTVGLAQASEATDGDPCHVDGECSARSQEAVPASADKFECDDLAREIDKPRSTKEAAANPRRNRG